MLRDLIRQVTPEWLLRLRRRVLGRRGDHARVSADYSILPAEAAQVEGTTSGWEQPQVAARQHEIFAELLRKIQAGKPRKDFVVLAEAVRAAAVANPVILEIGCASGWNYRVLQQLYARPFRYMGLDCSEPMLEIARREYPEAQFTRGDAQATPYADGVCDILISGTVLMHLADYRAAIRESRRLARRACIFHTVPVATNRPTTFMRKLAYGQPTLEVVFNEAELLACFAAAKLQVKQTYESLDYDLRSVLGESTKTKTYLCLPTA